MKAHNAGHQPSQKQRASGSTNTQMAARRAWNAYAKSKKMKLYHREQLTPAESERALTNGTWSKDQLAALKKAGLAAVLLVTLTTSSCAHAMLPRMTPAQMQQRAWQECSYELTDHWQPSCDGDCKNKAMLIQEWAGAHRTTMLVGWRHDQPMTLHIVPVLDGGLVIDYDGVHPLGMYLQQFDSVNSITEYQQAHNLEQLWQPEEQS